MAWPPYRTVWVPRQVSTEPSSAVERTNASECTRESEVAMISEFDLGTPLMTHVTPVMTQWEFGRCRGVSGLYRRLS